MKPTDDPMTYAFSHPEAKRVIYALSDSMEAYESLRNEFDVSPETFHRITRRLAQFDIVRFRTPKGSEFEVQGSGWCWISLREEGISQLPSRRWNDVIRGNPQLVEKRTRRLLLVEGTD